MSSRMRFTTRSVSVNSVPKCSLNVFRMLLSRSRFGSVILFRRGQLGRQEIEQDRKPLPLAVGVRHHRRQEVIASRESFRFALEVYLLVFIEMAHVNGNADV